MCTVQLKYAGFGGKKFGVEQLDSGRWIAVGRAKGQPPYTLDRLGDADCEQAMQGKLDAWAKKHGYRAVNMPGKQDVLELAGNWGGSVR